jgi:hypothetical protein
MVGSHHEALRLAHDQQVHHHLFDVTRIGKDIAEV